MENSVKKLRELNVVKVSGSVINHTEDKTIILDPWGAKPYFCFTYFFNEKNEIDSAVCYLSDSEKGIRDTLFFFRYTYDSLSRMIERLGYERSFTKRQFAGKWEKFFYSNNQLDSLHTLSNFSNIELNKKNLKSLLDTNEYMLTRITRYQYDDQNQMQRELTYYYRFPNEVEYEIAYEYEEDRKFCHFYEDYYSEDAIKEGIDISELEEKWTCIYEYNPNGFVFLEKWIYYKRKDRESPWKVDRTRKWKRRYTYAKKA